jgi:four helix bundle protein
MMQDANHSAMDWHPARSFEELPAYQAARKLANAVYPLAARETFARDPMLVDQLRRAAVATMSTIAQGFERESPAEFVRHLYIARGACGEVRAQILLAHDQRYIGDADHARLHELARQTSSLIAALVADLRAIDGRVQAPKDLRREDLGLDRRREAGLGDSSQTRPIFHDPNPDRR